MKKRGAMELSFGMIFSIILIIAFMAFAFYAIKTFLGVQDSAKVGIFKTKLQEEVNKVWRAPEASQKVNYELPSEVKEVCFKNWKYENVIFGPEESVNIPAINITNIDIEKTTTNKNPFCIEKKNGKFFMILKKDFGESLVTILAG